MSNENLVFVFGSNQRGAHGAGAAKEAAKNWGARYGLGEGHSGKSYAIPTKDFSIQSLTLDEVADGVEKFVKFAKNHPEYTFLVSKIGCGLAGFKVEDIAPLFKQAKDLDNVYFPYDFLEPLSLNNKRMSFNTHDKLADRFKNDTNA